MTSSAPRDPAAAGPDPARAACHGPNDPGPNGSPDPFGREPAPSNSLPGPGQRLVGLGQYAWAALGIAGVLVLGWLLAGLLYVVVVPLLLALFPAALLGPAVGWLHRHGLPRALATVIVVLVAATVVGGVVALVVPAFLTQLPALIESLTQAGTRLDDLVRSLGSVEERTTVGDLIREGALAFVGGVNAGLLAALNLLVGLLLVLVVLVCYLSGGSRIVSTGLALLPSQRRPDVREVLDRMWATLGSYTRALFLVGLFDATFIGIGLWLLGVPLVLPIAVLIFVGSLVPYIGPLVAGAFPVLVALADSGLEAAVAVLVLVIVVLQIEGNVVTPLLMGKAVRLSAFTVIVAVGIGVTLLGILGALIAVPTAACLARAVVFLREERESPCGADQAPEPTEP
jgi:predicted PurR-regulated permease PerM